MPTPKPGFHFTPTPPKEALAYLKAKKLKPAFDYRDVWREEHALGFSVAKAMQLDVLRAIRDGLAEALAKGKTFEGFKKDLIPTLQQKGWWGIKGKKDPKTGKIEQVRLGSPRRLRTIFWANTRTAYAAGQWERIEREAATHPYLRYELGPSKEHRLEHQHWNGLILSSTDAWWNAHMPPNGWGCKCRVRLLSKAEAGRLGGPGKPPTNKTRPWLNKRTGQIERVPQGIDPGWDTNPGKVRSQALANMLAAKSADAPVATLGPIPLLEERAVMKKKLSKAKGSNQGGVYQGADGIKRYVKFYTDPVQAYGEAAVNAIYAQLAVNAPKSALVARKQGGLALATEWIEGAAPIALDELTQAKAKKLLDGVAADAWLANWDALGQTFDNVVWQKGAPVRIDNGGALLFRAKAGRKNTKALATIGEAEGFFHPATNPTYAKAMEKAGVRIYEALGDHWLKTERAISNLSKKTNAFASLLPPVPGVPEPERLAMLQTLQKRAMLLKGVSRKVRAFAKLPVHEQGLMNLKGYQYQILLGQANTRAKESGVVHRFSEPELAALHGYTVIDYKPINQAKRGKLPKALREEYAHYTKTIIAGLAKLPNYRGKVTRGTTLPESELAKLKPGKVWTPKGFTSTSMSTDRAFNGPHRLKIQSRTGKEVSWISRHAHEKEVLFKPNTKFRVVYREKRGSVVEIGLKEIHDD